MASIIQELLNNCQRFSFFQAVRLLEQYCSSRVSIEQRGPAAPIGQLGPVEQETIRFRPHASFASQKSLIEAIEELENEKDFPRFLMTVTFLGLYGPDSPLPEFYTKEILEEDPDEATARNFLDLFHHRLLSLFYRCWEKYRYYVQYRPGATDQISQWMFALIGLGDPALRQSGHVQWSSLLPFLGILGIQTRSAAVLQSLISHYFGGVPVEIEQCVGHWVPLEDDQCNALGARNCSLAEDSILGDQFYDRSGKFRIHIGPLDFKTFQKFLPAGAFYQELRELVRFALRDQLAFDIDVILKTTKRRNPVLSRKNPCRLGLSMWLGNRGDRPAHDLAVLFPDG